MQVLDILVLYNPKKSSHAEELIYGFMPSLINANKNIILSKIKEVSQFMDAKPLYNVLKRIFLSEIILLFNWRKSWFIQKIRNIEYIISYKYAANYILEVNSISKKLITMIKLSWI